MSNYEDYSEIDKVPILRGISMLSSMTKLSIDYSIYIERAFLLGLWHRSFPEYMQGDLETAYQWSHKELEPPNDGHLLRFAFISDTGDSWHQCYRDLRNRGWQRLKVHRDGGRLQYLFKISGGILQADPEWYPKGFDEIHLVLDISLKTCKQVQVGTEMKLVPVMKTVCEDLADIQEDERYSIPPELPPVQPPTANPNEEFASLLGIVIDDIDELQRRRQSLNDAAPEHRCDHGNLSGNCPHSNCQFFTGEDSIPF